MISLTREAAQQVLDVLVLNNAKWKSLADSGDAGFWVAEEEYHYIQTEKAIATLQAAIDAPEQGPAWFACDTEGGEFDITFVTTQEEAAMAVDCALADDPDLKFEDLVTPLYTAPPAPQAQARELSDDDIDSIGVDFRGDYRTLRKFGYAD